MGMRFRRKIKIGPGITLNIGKTGISTSIGTRGAHVTIGKNGTRTTLGIPGTGLSYSSLTKADSFTDAGELPYLKQCPYCGHGLRKRWTACPSCHELLDQPLAPEITVPDVLKCPKCGEKYLIEGPLFCGKCGTRMNYRDAEEFPEELTPDIKEFLKKMNCIACPKCHAPTAIKGGWRYCKNCGTRLPHMPVPQITFSEGLKLFTTHIAKAFFWSIFIAFWLWVGYWLLKALPFLLGMLFFKAAG